MERVNMNSVLRRIIFTVDHVVWFLDYQADRTALRRVD
jgi:hypothetical protein